MKVGVNKGSSSYIAVTTLVASSSKKQVTQPTIVKTTPFTLRARCPNSKQSL